MKTKVLFKTLLFIVFFTISLINSSQANSNVNSSEEFKTGQHFIIQGGNQCPEKISSFACLKDNIFQPQLKNIYAGIVGETNDVNFIGKVTVIPGHDYDAEGCHRFAVFGHY